MERILRKRVVPAATVASVEQAEPLAEALLAGGLDIIEITFRTEAAGEAIARIRKRFPEMLVGAGTVLKAEQLRAAAGSGIQFAVAPGLNPEVVEEARKLEVAFMPGVATPGEVDHALRLGCRLQKFFPAQALGGPALLKAVGAPYAHTGLRFIPTGGINADNAAEYLRLPVVAAVGGSWMVAKSLVAERRWEEIAKLSREAVAMAAATSCPTG